MMASSPAAEPGDYIQLMKPRVMSLVVFTALIGMVVAPGSLHPVSALVAITLVAIGAGASGALNMWYDADIDQIMKRTAARPLPAGKVQPREALALGLVLSVFATMLLALIANITSAALLAVTIFFYGAIYTMWLKRRTPQNIVIGGAAGAFPPMIGWSIVTDSVTLESLALFAIIFLWTPPHFWALSLFAKLDYEKAGVPMLPVTQGAAVTRRQIVGYSVIYIVATLLPPLMGFMSWSLYGVVAGLTGLYFMRGAINVFRQKSGAEQSLFRTSIWHLFVIFAALALDHIVMGGAL